MVRTKYQTNSHKSRIDDSDWAAEPRRYSRRVRAVAAEARRQWSSGLLDQVSALQDVDRETGLAGPAGVDGHAREGLVGDRIVLRLHPEVARRAALTQVVHGAGGSADLDPLGIDAAVGAAGGGVGGIRRRAETEVPVGVIESDRSA